MRLGATLAHLADAAPRPAAEWARRLVDAGFESLWAPEIIARGPLVPDPFVLLAAAAAVTGGATGTLELGTATVQVPLHHPVELAHRVHSLLAVCGDRLTLGVSPGSTGTDHAALGRDFGRRFDVLHHDLARLQALLTDGRDEQVVVAPAPLRPPPLLLGSWGANVERAAREFDGWLASGVRRTPDEILEALGRYRAAGGGRAVVCAVPVDAGTDLGRLRDDLGRYAEAGFDDAVVLIAPGGPEPARVRALCP